MDSSLENSKEEKKGLTEGTEKSRSTKSGAEVHKTAVTAGEGAREFQTGDPLCQLLHEITFKTKSCF